ncbi:MAG: hypothetical protein ACI8QD_001661 [Cyclobacteriaceae bacterium]|jgi:hypothetical protein
MRKLSYFLSLVSLLILFSITKSYAQSVSSVEVSIVEDDLHVTYNMSGLSTGQKFNVEIYSSLDNYTSPLSDDRITGDLGSDIILEGGNLIVIADPLESLGAITGDLNFKIRANLIYNPVNVIEPVAYFKQKRLKDFNVVWSGGLGGEQVKFDIYKDNQLIQDNVFTTVNNRSAEFKMPKLALGAGYTMMMEFESLNQEVAIPDFEIKRKSSIFSKVFKIVLLAAAVDFALYASSGEMVPEDQVGGFVFKIFDPLGIIDNSLPEPPGTPTGMTSASFTLFSF